MIDLLILASFIVALAVQSNTYHAKPLLYCVCMWGVLILVENKVASIGEITAMSAAAFELYKVAIVAGVSIAVQRLYFSGVTSFFTGVLATLYLIESVTIMFGINPFTQSVYNFIIVTCALGMLIGCGCFGGGLLSMCRGIGSRFASHIQKGYKAY